MEYDILVTVTNCNINFQSLAVTVWHHDKMKQNDYLGADALDNFIAHVSLIMPTVDILIARRSLITQEVNNLIARVSLIMHAVEI